MVIIPKGGGGYRGIGLVRVVWKVCTLIMNSRIQSAIILHNTLHGFRQGMGERTDIMEVNLEQQLAGTVHEPLFQVFIDVKKAYDS